MKGKLLLFFLPLLMIRTAHCQPSLADYLAVVVEFTEAGKNLEAVKLCDRLSVIHSENPDVFFLRGINHYLLGEYDEAEEDLDRTIMLDPGYPDIYLHRAKVRKAKKDYFGALMDYRRAKDKDLPQTFASLTGDLIRSIFSD